MSERMKFHVGGMHCDACVRKITEALESVEGVERAEVSLEQERAIVAIGTEVDFDALKDAVSEKGEYSLERQEKDNSDDVHPALRAEREGSDDSDESLYPLFLIAGYLAGAVVLGSWASGEWSAMVLMRRFMAGFFLAFSFFKLLDLAGFVGAYRGYDLLAKRSRAYAYAYPFIELLLGVLFLTGTALVATSAVTVVLMLVGAAGVLKALLDKEAVRCGCLGTAINLPMTTVTLIEDLTMAAMGAVMLVMLT